MLDILARTEGISWTDAARHRAKVGVGKIAGVPVLLAKPQTYMNLSGESVRSLCRWYKIPNSNLLVVYDDLDTAVGAIKLKGKGGHGGHNGIRNIIDEVCGDKVFARVKFGIGRPKPGVEVYDHVLTKFGDDEATELESKGTWAKACDAVRGVLVDGLDKAMSAVYTNTRRPSSEGAEGAEAVEGAEGVSSRRGERRRRSRGDGGHERSGRRGEGGDGLDSSLSVIVLITLTT